MAVIPVPVLASWPKYKLFKSVFLLDEMTVSRLDVTCVCCHGDNNMPNLLTKNMSFLLEGKGLCKMLELSHSLM